MKRISLLPSLLTLANFFVGLLAIAKGIDALVDLGHVGLGQVGAEALFYRKLEGACLLIFAGMVLDGLDGRVARWTKSESQFGAQLDSFADALTFGVAPALLTKILIDGEARILRDAGFAPRLTFLAAAAFSTMAILRLVRFNLETDLDESAHREFRGLPSPAAAGAVTATLWLGLILRRPDLEVTEGSPTPLGRLLRFAQAKDWAPILEWLPTYLLIALPVLGLLMVSRVRYVHVVSLLFSGGSQFFTLVAAVICAYLVYLAPVPALFFAFNGFVIFGLLAGARKLAHRIDP